MENYYTKVSVNVWCGSVSHNLLPHRHKIRIAFRTMTNININTQREDNDLNHQIHIFNEIAHNLQRFIAWN